MLWGRFFRIRPRTLRVYILSLFLSLITLAFAFVITFTYIKNYSAIIHLAGGVARRVSHRVETNFSCVTEGAARSVKVASGLYWEFKDISFENEELTSFLLNIIKNDLYLSSFSIGTIDGRFMGAIKLSTFGQFTYALDPNRLLPAGSDYSLRLVDLTKTPAIDVFLYFNNELQLLETEPMPEGRFDPRKRPWFVDAQEAKKMVWTSVYHFLPRHEKGISIANPIFDSQENLTAVIAADLSFIYLVQFFTEEKIGKTGRVFLLKKNGEVILPQNADAQGWSTISHGTLAEAYLIHVQEDREDFVFSSDGINYIANIRDIYIVGGRPWKLAIIVPLSDFLEDLLRVQLLVILIILGILVLTGFIVFYFSRKISSPIVTLANEVNQVRELNFESEFRVTTNIKEIQLMDNSIAALRSAIRSFISYVPREVVKGLIQKGEGVKLGGEKKELTIFFSDIEGFTSIAEEYSIDVLLPLLSEYFDAMSKFIIESEGTIDKFLGDGIMAFWGAPSDVPDHALKACTAALRCKAFLVDFNRMRKEQRKPEFHTRFGVHTGTVIVGNIGTDAKMNYTVIGDAVNLTSRLQGIDKFYHTTIIISEDTLLKLNEDFLVRPLDFVAVKGRKEKVKIFELRGVVIGDRQILAPPEDIELCRSFTAAYEAYLHKDYERALALFSDLQQKFPGDFPTQIYLERIKIDRLPPKP